MCQKCLGQKIHHPEKIVSTSQEVEVTVLEIDTEKRRVSLGLKQTTGNPWENFASNNPVGTTIQGEVKEHNRVWSIYWPPW